MNQLSQISNKIVDLKDALKQRENWKSMQESVVFTNGCFDILHVGHVTYLARAKDLGNHLIVAINTDNSVKRLGKGDERPINPQEARALTLAALSSVDLVVFFDDDTPLTVIESLNPDVLVKGSDYNPDEIDPTSKQYIVGSSYIKQQGGQVAVISLVEGYSTSAIAAKLKSK
jgi:D-beta-D-heptose 7-phosphate kinase/D-beta-D-heptose 1-phosphate adenosyltransferase